MRGWCQLILIALAMEEIKLANPAMNIGRETNENDVDTLILVFAGTGLKCIFNLGDGICEHLKKMSISCGRRKF